jgi:hypothetical protein
MKSIGVDCKSFTNEILNLLVEKFPDGLWWFQTSFDLEMQKQVDRKQLKCAQMTLVLS